MWPLYGELGYLIFTGDWSGGKAGEWHGSITGDEGAVVCLLSPADIPASVVSLVGVLLPELTFCSEELRVGGFGFAGTGDGCFFCPALAGGLLNALVSEDLKDDEGP